MAGEFRQKKGKGDLPDWPSWCFLPRAGWGWIVCDHHDLPSAACLTVEDADKLRDIICLTALGAWRYTQGIYRYQPDLLAALSVTDLSGDLPAEILFRLPEWCLYVETPGWTDDGYPLHGFFSFLDFDPGSGDVTLCFVLNSEAGLIGGPTLMVGPWPLLDAARKNTALAARRSPEYARSLGEDAACEMASTASPMLSLLLYICSDAPDIAGHESGTYPRYPQPKKTKKGWRLFPPDKPRIWRIGEETGEKLRRAAERAREKPAGEAASPRGHVRRGHWHGYWTGPRKPRPGIPEEQRQRRFGVRWLHPMLVGVDDA
jgi:hypothetical protein